MSIFYHYVLKYYIIFSCSITWHYGLVCLKTFMRLGCSQNCQWHIYLIWKCGNMLQHHYRKLNQLLNTKKHASSEESLIVQKNESMYRYCSLINFKLFCNSVYLTLHCLAWRIMNVWPKFQFWNKKGSSKYIYMSW